MKARYDCSQCPSYCCSYDRIPVSDFDIARLARHFVIGIAAARKRFTYRHHTKDVDERVLRHQRDGIFKSVCQFFDASCDAAGCTLRGQMSVVATRAGRAAATTSS